MRSSTYGDIRTALMRGDTSCTAVIENAFDALRASERLNAFISLHEEAALTAAARVDERLRSGTAGPLAGMTVAIKDALSMKGTRTTCGSKILSNFDALYDCTAVKRLLDADAIVIGKTNMDEFAMGSSNENSAFGAVLNPRDTSRVPGGSSGGSAAAVAASIAMTALGTDTGGSIRQPAAFCGVVGVKPTYGRVSRHGLVAFASSCDCIGPFARSVEDAARVLEVIAGHDPHDSTSSSVPLPVYHKSIGRGVEGLRIGIPKEFFLDSLDSSIREAIERVLDRLRESGARIEEISLPHTEYTIATYYIITTAEASSNLARYDGARYGRRAGNASTLAEMYVNSRSEGFGAEVKRRIMLGTYVLSAGYYDAYYKKAQQVRRLIKQDFDQAFARVDAIVTPTTPTTAFVLGEKIADPLQMYLSDVFTASGNLAGIPGLSLPVGVDASNLPIGAQVYTRSFDEEMLFRVGSAIEAIIQSQT